MTQEIKDALSKPGVVVDRWVLRLGKNDVEAGRFEPWFLPSSTFEQDLEGFLACLNLVKLHDNVKECMSAQAKGVRAIKKQQKAEQKEIAKMKAKVDKAAEKAQKRLDRAAERERIKTDAKRNREEAKLAKRGGTKGQLVHNEPASGEVPRQAEDSCTTHRHGEVGTQGNPEPSALVSATVAEIAGDTQASQGIPVCEDVRSISESSLQNSAHAVVEKSGQLSAQQGVVEEAPISRKPFVIPEEE